MFKLMTKMQSMFLAGYTDEPQLLKNLKDFFTNTVLKWTLWGVTCFFIILVIQAGVKMGMAKSPEEKQANKSKLIGIVIGFCICLIASAIVTTLAAVFGELNTDVE